MASLSDTLALVAIIGMMVSQPHAEQAMPPWIRSGEGQVLNAPRAQEATGKLGLRLVAVHTHYFTPNSLVHLRHPVAQPPEMLEGRRLPYTGTNQRDLIRLLTKLNIAAVPITLPAPAAAMAPILEAQQSLFGQSVTTYNDEVAAMDEARAALIEDLEAINNTGPVIAHGGLDYDATAQTTAVSGPHAMEFAAENVGRVLVFRGTFNLAEFENLKLWITDWVLKKHTAALKDQWVNLAGLEWTDQMERDRQPWNLTTTADEMLRGGSWYFNEKFLNDTADFASSKNNQNFNLDVDAIREESFWEITKLIARSVRSSLRQGETLRITGVSQGGARASLVSMYLKKTYGEAIETITFGAVGSSCFPRQIWHTGANHLDDVDPHMQHPQIKDYTHVLDIYGHWDMEVGYDCYYGKTDLATSAAKEYCERIFGHQGVELHVAGFAAQWGLLTELFLDLQRCLYFTHSWAQFYFYLIQSDDFIIDDGDTDIGCKLREAIPLNDPEGLCPSSQVPWMDGCEDKTSCEACTSSTSNLGYDCLWCAETKTCVSQSTAWFESCASTWLESDGTCSSSETGNVSGVLPAVALHSSTIALILFPLILLKLQLF